MKIGITTGSAKEALEYVKSYGFTTRDVGKLTVKKVKGKSDRVFLFTMKPGTTFDTKSKRK